MATRYSWFFTSRGMPTFTAINVLLNSETATQSAAIGGQSLSPGRRGPHPLRPRGAGSLSEMPARPRPGMVWPKQSLPSTSTRLGSSEDASHSQRVVNVSFEHLVDEDVQRHALDHHVEFFI